MRGYLGGGQGRNRQGKGGGGQRHRDGNRGGGDHRGVNGNIWMNSECFSPGSFIIA